MTPPISQSDDQDLGQTILPKSPTPVETDQISSQSDEPAKWTIRGIEPETRRVIEKAAKRSGKNLGQFFNSELREAATIILKKAISRPLDQKIWLVIWWKN